MEVWKESMALALMVYKLTENFPKTELYGLTSQIRRCSVSIPSNIAEGSVKFSNKETLRFIEISIGSLAELDTQLLLSKDLDYYTEEAFLKMNIDNIECDESSFVFNKLLSRLYPF